MRSLAGAAALCGSSTTGARDVGVVGLRPALFRHVETCLGGIADSPLAEGEQVVRAAAVDVEGRAVGTGEHARRGQIFEYPTKE